MRDVPLLGFAAFSGTGKTTLLTRLLPLLRERGLRLGVIKHAHHSFDIDQPGKDSYRLRQAGASPIMVVSRRRRAVIYEYADQGEVNLHAQLPYLGSEELDLVLVEGFKHAAIAKIELHRPRLGHPLLFPEDTNVIAIATDAPLPISCPLPQLDLNRPEQIASFIVHDFLR